MLRSFTGSTTGDKTKSATKWPTQSQRHGINETRQEVATHEKKQGRAAEATDSEEKKPGAKASAMEKQLENGSAILADVVAAKGRNSVYG